MTDSDLLAEGREFLRSTFDERQRWTRELLTGGRPVADERVDAEFKEAESPAGDSESPQVPPILDTSKVVDGSVPLEFADKALRQARAVGRLVAGENTGLGTCFMISPRLLATAGHVLRRADLENVRAEFKFGELTSHKAVHARFRLAPDTLWLPPDKLGGIDVAVIALGAEDGDTGFTPGHCALPARNSIHPTQNHANVVHHPRSDLAFVMRDNWMMPNDKTFLSYRADTDEGSSGAPVFNNRWELVAIHVEGRRGEKPLLRVSDEISISDEVNFGIRSSVVHERLRAVAGLDAEQQRLVDEAAPA